MKKATDRSSQTYLFSLFVPEMVSCLEYSLPVEGSGDLPSRTINTCRYTDPLFRTA